LNELEAFDAMRAFLEAFWERGGKASQDISDLLSWLARDTWADGSTADPAQWEHWLGVLKKTKG
jgi:hypothetical protein